ncbi:MAG: LytTR family DNA-binding domain-containing protein [Clostridiales bacterium]|nr:LytTR family DNA-binding domain-containing protein [Clostridiales bacterium]
MRIAVAEDEAACVTQLKRYLAQVQEEAGIPLSADFFPDGAALVQAYSGNYDVLLLDIEMPLMDGMTAAQEIRKRDSEVMIMFITRMARYAVKGYQVRAFDFVVKPISYSIFSVKLRQMADQIERRSGKELLLTTEDGVCRLTLPHIHYIEVINHRLQFHTDQGIRKSAGTLNQMEKELHPYGFARCNSGFLVNLRYVTEVRKNVAVVAGEELIISRPRRKAFLQELTDYVGGLR